MTRTLAAVTRVKICGNTNYGDALCAAQAGADLLGFIFYAKSPRAVTVEATRAMVAALRADSKHAGWRMPLCVGVFVNETALAIARVLREAGLDAAQLHGNETPADLAALGPCAFKAIKRVDELTAGFAAGIRNPGLPALLLDADHPTLYGGSGLRADESVAAQLARNSNLLLAGGLTPENVTAAIRAVRPWGVDVASGVEQSPGGKDHAKVRAFVQAAKQSRAAHKSTRPA